MDIFGRKSPEKQLKKIHKLSAHLPENGRSLDGNIEVTKNASRLEAIIMKPIQGSYFFDSQHIVIISDDDRIQKITRRRGRGSIDPKAHKEIFDTKDINSQQLDLGLIIDEMKQLVSRTVEVEVPNTDTQISRSGWVAVNGDCVGHANLGVPVEEAHPDVISAIGEMLAPRYNNQ